MDPCTDRSTMTDTMGQPGIVIGMRRASDSKVPHVYAGVSITILGETRGLIDSGVANFGTDEFPVQMMAKLTTSKIYFDVGANHGLTSLPVAAMSEKHIVHGFEPVPNMVDRLCISKTLGHWQFNDRLHYVETVVTNFTGRTILYIPKGREDNAASSRLSITVPGEPEPKDVQALKLDDYIAALNIDVITLLKIDVQGGELFVLKGAENALKTGKIQAIYAENSAGLMEGNGVTPEMICGYMLGLGWYPYGEDWNVFNIVDNTFVVNPKAKRLLNCRDTGNNIFWFPG